MPPKTYSHPKGHRMRRSVGVRRGLSLALRSARADLEVLQSESTKASGLSRKQLREYERAIQWMEQASLP